MTGITVRRVAFGGLISTIIEPDSSGTSTSSDSSFYTAEGIAKITLTHPRTVEGWHEKGYITGYRRRGGGVILFDIREVERELKRRPRTQMRDGRRKGDHGVVVELPA